MADRHAHHHHLPGSHGGAADPALRRRLTLALALILAFMAVEVVVALLASSLALLSDAAHMLTDAAALAMAVLAARLAERPASGAFTFGWRRGEILSAQANGAMLLVLALAIGVGAVLRLADPPAVDGASVLAVALAGIVVNLAATRILHPQRAGSLNVEGAFQHLLTDLFAFMATAVAGAVVLLSGWRQADPVAALLVAILMLRAALGLLRASGRVLLEGAPAGLRPEEIGRAMAAERGVVEVHDLHVWELTSSFPALSAHVVVGTDSDCHGIRARLETVLRQRFSITHSTLQVEHEHSPLLEIEGAPEAQAPRS
jgi:cobalt-zinc-cadmium efflux system protein